jgi:hypothetical protein
MPEKRQAKTGAHFLIVESFTGLLIIVSSKKLCKFVNLFRLGGIVEQFPGFNSSVSNQAVSILLFPGLSFLFNPQFTKQFLFCFGGKPKSSTIRGKERFVLIGNILCNQAPFN